MSQLDELFIVLGPKQGEKPDAKPDAGQAPDASSTSDTNAAPDAGSAGVTH